jgi:putative transposase
VLIGWPSSKSQREGWPRSARCWRTWGFPFNHDEPFQQSPCGASFSTYHSAPMPLGLKRYHQSGQTHSLTFGCYRRLRHFSSPLLRTLFVRKLEQTRVRFGLRVFAFVVMPEHVHLLLSEPSRADLATAMQSLKLSVSLESKRYFRIHPSDRHRFWQNRYFDLNVQDHEQFLEKLHYIHQNPVRGGLVQSAENREWSSFLHYAEGSDVGVEIESERTASSRLLLT